MINDPKVATLKTDPRTTERLYAEQGAAATHLYDTEVALHIARQSQVDAWISAAYDKLHQAILQHEAAQAAASRAR
jgi:hypothetical protein